MPNQGTSSSDSVFFLLIDGSIFGYSDTTDSWYDCLYMSYMVWYMTPKKEIISEYEWVVFYQDGEWDEDGKWEIYEYAPDKIRDIPYHYASRKNHQHIVHNTGFREYLGYIHRVHAYKNWQILDLWDCR